jgi:hypothetical protein
MRRAYVKLSRGRLQVIIECVHVCTIFLGIYCCSDELANVEPNFYKLGVLGERLFDLRISPC